MSYKKLSPDELEALGFGRKTERYLDTATGATISKRAYLTQQRGGLTNEQIAKLYQSGKKTYENKTFEKAAKAKRAQVVIKNTRKSSGKDRYGNKVKTVEYSTVAARDLDSLAAKLQNKKLKDKSFLVTIKDPITGLIRKYSFKNSEGMTADFMRDIMRTAGTGYGMSDAEPALLAFEIVEPLED